LPKLHAKEDYKAWKGEVPLHFDTCTLGDITYGEERYNEEGGLRRPKYAWWYETRKHKAFSALSLSVDLRTTFKVDDIRDSMDAPSLLYAMVTQHFEAGDGINPDYLLQDAVTRRLQPSERVTAYIEDMARKVTLLRQANGEMEEWQHASLLLANSLLVLPNLAREHSDWINTHDRRSLKLAEALQRLRSADHQRDQLSTETKQAVPRTMRVAQVSAHQGQGKTRKRSKHQRGKAGHEKKAKTNCANCRADGHWYAECTEKTGKPLKPELARKLAEKQGRRQPTSLVNSVRRVEVDDGQQHGLSDGRSVHASSTPMASEPSGALMSPNRHTAITLRVL
jgi:hypothetical protein